ncbi:MAG: septal ring lytic transglycosylase RlpA family protein [Moritella sp.]|uniref:septal ring lytic transglycosylase RlpA family protein n=1 Tax=Moritella sp. TaxID=78556 RepID=UPI0029A8D486|nr:septal ring lytic transglycosylase RlpA family protein [Moritella sp.]MDX2320604.1 septal ring lytic transglycosylase RlpA family protein [Moritella sp.]
MRNKQRLTLLCICGLLAACSSSRYQYNDDHAPENIPQLDDIADAVPIPQTYSHYANRDYQVRGIDYEVWRDIKTLTQEGKASWYGNKFHGHKTSNGEIYDMFSMSAAHKNLPLPSFVKVTNLGNDKTVVVRVNDRGPFHSERIIDLSYAAAYKLDMLQSGTANVRVELIIPTADNSTLFTPTSKSFIQVLASSSKIKAQQVADALSAEHKTKNRLVSSGKYYRVQLGPITDSDKAQALLAKVQQKYTNAYVLKELSSKAVSNKL